ncbi:MAG: thioredoxin family protein [Spirochaetota bacterium]|jgi:thioredoxin-related protein|nr:thioredoxin family protein [Spirochaetota bacterium]
MKKCVGISVSLFLFFCCTMCARDSWSADLDAAIRLAGKNNRPILAIFSSRNANPLCERLAAAAIDSPGFTQEASKSFNLAWIDMFGAIKEGANPAKSLAQRYGISQLPAVFLLDTTGRSYALCDYTEEDGHIWLAELQAMDAQLEERNLLLKNAVREQDPAKRLTAFTLAVDAFTAWGIIRDYPELKAEVIRLDADNAAGLQAKYLVEHAIGEISSIYLATNGFEAGLAKLGELLAEYAQGEPAQQIYYTMAALKIRLGSHAEARDLMQKALFAAPASKQAETIRAALASLDFNPD